MEMDIFNSAGLYVSRNMQVIFIENLWVFNDDDDVDNEVVSNCF